VTDTAYDGTPIQSGLLNTSLTGRAAGFTMIGMREAVVVSRRAVDEKGNRSRKAVEYDCRDLQTGDIYPACRRLDHMSGALNGDDDVLHPATNLRTGAKNKLDRQTPANQTDGDQVLIGFVEGSRNKPVIVGVFRHPDATYGAKVADGERRYTTHGGTSVEITSQGVWRVLHKSGATLEVMDSGDVKVIPAPGKTILLGDAGLTALDGVVTGQGIDTFTGATYAALNNASATVLAKKT